MRKKGVSETNQSIFVDIGNIIEINRIEEVNSRMVALRFQPIRHFYRQFAR